MYRFFLFIRKTCYLFLCIDLISSFYAPQISLAASLTGLSDTLSSTTTNASGVSHTAAFTIATSSPIQRIDFQFSTTSGGNTKPAGLDLSSATLGSLTNLNDTSWGFSTGSASTGLLTLSRVSATTLSSGTNASVVLQNITNSSIGDCTSTGELNDICYLNITTYSDSGATPVDTGTTTYTLQEDPTLQFEVSAVASGTTHNGITTDVTSTATSIDFGTLAPNSVKYGAQKIKVSTNAPHGYTIYAALANPISGLYNNSEISPFGATNATWTTPQLWDTPTGTTANSNTGWFGANTTDTRVAGWSGTTTQKFGPISTTPHIVAYSSSADPTGTDVYITYALGVNSVQPSDTYTGKIIYNVYASY